MSYYQPKPDPYTYAYGHPNYQVTDTSPLTQRGQDEKFSSTTWRDLPWAILFVLHLIGFGIFSAVGAMKAKDENSADTTDYIPEDSEKVRTVWLIALLCAGVGAFLSFLWLFLVRKFSRQIIHMTITLSVLFWLGIAILWLAQGQLIMGIVMFAIALFNAFLFYLWRNRIPFAAAMLETLASIIEQYPATTHISYLSLVFQLGWVILWVWTVSQIQKLQLTSLYFVSLFLVFSLYWTAQVIKNTVHVTISGTFATWYFLGRDVPQNPTWKAFKRSITTSFGSICLGSMLVALLQTLRYIFRSLTSERNGWIAWIAACIVGCIENLLQYFNVYAFTQVAIYGKTYCQAAKDTWSLLHSHGVEAIINDNLISPVLGMGSFLGAIICSVAGAVAGFVFIKEYWITCAVLGFVIGFTMVMLTMEVVASGAATIFVCFAMDPEALRRNSPQLYEKFRMTYHEQCDFLH